MIREYTRFNDIIFKDKNNKVNKKNQQIKMAVTYMYFNFK